MENYEKLEDRVVQIARRYFVDDFFFIQIGSNDGRSGDPIYQYVKQFKWTGILVEPVPHVFKRLRQTYRQMEGLFFVNAAVDVEDGYRTFYRIEENYEAGIPIWYTQIGSFKKELILKHKHSIPNFDKHFISEQIR